MRPSHRDVRERVILAEARRVLSTEGSAALNMKALAEVTGVPRATLYRAYPGKDELVRAVTLAWGTEFAQRIARAKPRGGTRGARLTSLYRRLLREAEGDPKLIAAVLESLAVGDANAAPALGPIEALWPNLVRLVVDVDRMHDADQVLEVLLGVLFANLQWMTSGRTRLDQALSSLVFATERLVGTAYWQGQVGA